MTGENFGQYLEERERIRLKNNPRYEECYDAYVIGQAWSTGDEPPLYVRCRISGEECLGNCLSHTRPVIDPV